MLNISKKNALRLRYLDRAILTACYNKFVLGSLAPSRRETIFVDPGKIVGHMNPEQALKLIKKTGYYSGAVVDGDWDREVKYLDITGKGVYTSCLQRWIYGYSWEDTPIYQTFVNKIKQKIPCEFNSLEDLEKRYDRLDSIYNQVCSERKMSSEYRDLVPISIARDGSLIWGPNGKHRICIALIAGLELMPAKVRYIHKKGLNYFQEMRIK